MSVVIHPKGYILSTSVRLDKNVEPTQKKIIKFVIQKPIQDEINKYNEEHKDEIEANKKKCMVLKKEDDRLKEGNYIEESLINGCKPFCMVKCISKDYYGWNYKKEFHQYTFNLQCEICKIHSKRKITYTQEEYKKYLQ